MTANIITPASGRRAWSTLGTGGTLNLSGTGPGKYYRAIASGAVGMEQIGLAGYRADRDWDDVTLDQYAVWCAAKAVQTELKDRGLYTGTIDGIWGSQTDTAVRTFQRGRGLTADGIYGPSTSEAMWETRVREIAKTLDAEHPDLADIMVGTIALESAWDPGAVGSDPNDLGLGQLNGPANPSMSVNDRLNPKLALPYIGRLVLANLRAMNFNVRDAIAAYNLGVTGCRNWITVGRPDNWKNRNVKAYIDKILAAGTA